MASKTVVYSNSGKFWKTRYSFISSCYAFLNKMFFSGRQTSARDLVWKHNSDQAQRTDFYGGGAIGSAFTASFSKTPSENKIYKSFSIEGTQGINADNAINLFYVNTDNQPIKTTNLGRVTDRGGILYGHIGQSINFGSGSNLRVIGMIRELADVTGEILIDFYPPVDSAPASQDSIYLFGLLTDEGMQFVFLDGEPVTINSNSNYNFILGAPNFNPVLQNRPNAVNDTPLVVTDPDSQYFGFRRFTDLGGAALSADIVTAIGTQTAFLVEVNPQEIFGDDPRGQYATIALAVAGGQPYEINALNLNYEPTDLDHNQ